MARPPTIVAITAATLAFALVSLPANAQQQRIRLSWGLDDPKPEAITPRLFSVDGRVRISEVHLSRSVPGATGGIEALLSWDDPSASEFTDRYKLPPLPETWLEFLASSDPDTAERVGQDPAFEPGSPLVAIELKSKEPRGFSLSMGQLQKKRAFWVPAYHVFVQAGDSPPSFETVLRSIHPQERIRERVKAEPEATRADFAGRWEDTGSDYHFTRYQQGPGHLIGLGAVNSALKYGIDRGGAVWNAKDADEKLRFWFGFGEVIDSGLHPGWISQRIEDGYPIVETIFERDGVRYALEQWIDPREPTQTLYQRLSLKDLGGKSRDVAIDVNLMRQPNHASRPPWLVREAGDMKEFVDPSSGVPRLFVSGKLLGFRSESDPRARSELLSARFIVPLPAGGTAELRSAIPPARAGQGEGARVAALDFESSRQATRAFWSDEISRGAMISVPEPEVNDLFRASLWHARMLPTRTRDKNRKEVFHLPYSNFAYMQKGAPWPFLQAIYIDSMNYALRGDFDWSNEELRSLFTTNQKPDGHLSGFADWFTATPALVYAVAKSFLLSNDVASFRALQKQTERAWRWCMAQVKDGGLVTGALNDGTGKGIWAFNQAYLYGALETYSRALERLGDHRARETRSAAQILASAIDRGFGQAALRSPLVPLRDGSWSPFVPTNAVVEGRSSRSWYPTDVDTGPLHLLETGALSSNGDLANALLDDAEDNLFLHGWGAANEPIYEPQFEAYLKNDVPEAAIRTFYSLMTSGFSHHSFEPLEHRWGNDQFFGPPSTDGTWLNELRELVVYESDHSEAITLGYSTPRPWLEDGKSITVERLPTEAGYLSFHIDSHVAQGRINVEYSWKPHLITGAVPELRLRLRHPEKKRLASVEIDGQPSTGFDPVSELIQVPNSAGAHSVIAHY